MSAVTVPGPFGALKVSPILTCAHGPNFRVHFGPIVAHSLFKPCFGGAQVAPYLSSRIWSGFLVGPSTLEVLTVSGFIFSTNASGSS